MRISVDQFLRQYLDMHHAACPFCGYDLKSCESLTCPECGAALRLTIAGPSTVLVPWMCLIIALSLQAGVGVRRWFAESIRGFPSLFPWKLPHVEWYWYLLHYEVMLSPVFLLLAVFFHKRLMCRNVRLAWILTGLATAAFLAECWSLVR